MLQLDYLGYRLNLHIMILKYNVTFISIYNIYGHIIIMGQSRLAASLYLSQGTHRKHSPQLLLVICSFLFYLYYNIFAYIRVQHHSTPDSSSPWWALFDLPTGHDDFDNIPIVYLLQWITNLSLLLPKPRFHGINKSPTSSSLITASISPLRHGYLLVVSIIYYIF